MCAGYAAFGITLQYAACAMSDALAPACATVQEANWNRFRFCLATLSKQLSATSGANKNFRTQ